MVKSPPTKASFEELRNTIIDKIEKGATFQRPRRQMQALQDQYGEDWDLQWQETSILLNCYLQVKAARTHGALGRLRRQRAKRGEGALFDSFMQRVSDVLHPQFITPHGYCTTFAQLDADAIFADMGKAVAPLAAYGFPMFLYAGALLGHIRSGQLIGHDDDIDIGVYLGEVTEAEAAVKWAAFKHTLAEASLLEPECIAQGQAIFKLQSSFPVGIDIFPAWTWNGRFSVYPYSLGNLPEESILPLKTFGQDPLMLPADPEALLVQSYGEGWKTPDPLFHLNWPEMNRKFQTLLAQDYAISVDC